MTIALVRVLLADPFALLFWSLCAFWVSVSIALRNQDGNT